MASFGYDGDIGAGEWVTAQRILGCRYAVLEPGCSVDEMKELFIITDFDVIE